MRLATIVMVALGAVSFWTFVSLPRLIEGFSSMTVVFSITAAAVLVRLNRGMPTLDWKSLKPNERRRLTQHILSITKEYVVVLATVGILLVALVALTVVGKDVVVGTATVPGWPSLVKKGISTVVGGLSTLALLRMMYVVWRDYDVVRLQKALLDDAGLREEKEQEAEAGKRRLADIRSSRVNTPSILPPKSWDAP